MTIYTRSIGPPSVPAGPYILLVDDIELMVSNLAQILRLVGFATVGAKSVPDALACSFHRKPSLVVTDLDMPRHDGRALARRVKRRHPGVPILLVTGQDLDHPDWLIPDGLFAGIFPKPFDFEPFLKTVERLMPPSSGKATVRPRP